MDCHFSAPMNGELNAHCLQQCNSSINCASWPRKKSWAFAEMWCPSDAPWNARLRNHPVKSSGLDIPHPCMTSLRRNQPSRTTLPGFMFPPWSGRGSNVGDTIDQPLQNGDGRKCRRASQSSTHCGQESVLGTATPRHCFCCEPSGEVFDMSFKIGHHCAETSPAISARYEGLGLKLQMQNRACSTLTVFTDNDWAGD